jgi:translocation and assembly module TamB
MRRFLKVAALVVTGLVLVLLLAVLLAYVLGNTERGRLLITGLVDRLTAHQVRLTGLTGDFPAHLKLDHLVLADDRGAWLTADRIVLDWSPLELIKRRVSIERLSVARLDVERTPQSSEPQGPSPSIPHIEVGQLSIDELGLGAPLVGTPATLVVRGSVRLRSLEDASTDLSAQRTNGTGDYRVHLHFDPRHLDGTLDVREPAGGPLEHLLDLPGLGALSAQVRLAGERRAEHLEAAVSAGPLTAKAAGEIDLGAQSGNLDVSLDSAALAPREGLAWERLTLGLHMSGTLKMPVGDGRLEASGVRIAGAQLASLTARVRGHAGVLETQAQLSGVQLPGPAQQLLAPSPLEISARLELTAPHRPLAVTATHRLFALELHALTTERMSGTGSLRLADLAPFANLAGLGGAVAGGDALISGRVEQRAGDVLGIALKGDAARLTGSAPWLGAIDHRLALDLAGQVTARSFDLERLRLTAPALAATLSGSARRASATAQGRSGLASVIESMQTRWTLDLGQLERFSSNLKGNAHLAGRLEGAPSSLNASGELRAALSIRDSPTGVLGASFTARGLPGTPSGSLKAHGLLDGAPLEIDAELEPARRGVHALVRRADWKSAHLKGDLAFDTQAAAADRGEMHLTVGNLGDFDRLLGTTLAGRIEGRVLFMPSGRATQAHLDLDASDLRAGAFTGQIHLQGQGNANAVALEVAATLPLAGTPAALSSAGRLDLDDHTLHIDRAVLHYRQAEVSLLAPAEVRFAQGLALEHVTLGLRGARLEVDGSVLPNLALRASLVGADAALVNAFAPDTLAAGAMRGSLHLTGRLAAPEGDIRLDATGLRLAEQDAASLPPGDIRVRAQLHAGVAHLDGHLTARGESLLAISGEVPLDEMGRYDLQGVGKLDIALVNPLLEARGMHAAGGLKIDAALAGTRAAPQIHGTIELERGSLRDYAHGVNLTHLSAKVSGNEDRLAIDHFTASAGSGTVTVTGTLNPLERGVPLALDVTATNAQPVASNLLTMTLDSKLSVRGTLLERIDVQGSVRIDRALIGIPDSLPPEVVVLDVRRAGQHAPAPPARALSYAFDITMKAPNQVLVQGRGLDAELGGEVHIGGTSDQPLVSGGFDLQRGTFSIGGSTLKLKPPGRVSFDDAGLRNKIDPTIDFTAESTVADVGTSVTATLKISGYADAPKFEFSSVPERPPDEIMALLLFGQPPGQLSALQLAQIGAALASLTGVGGGGPNPLVKLQRSLGLDRLTVGSNTMTTATGAIENSGAAIAAGRYVTRRVYVEGRQTTTGESQVQVDVDLTKHLKLQTRLGNGGNAVTQGTTPENDPGSSIGLSYQFEY